MKDGYNRKITYMRLSVTDRCNFKCKYCNSGTTSKCYDLLTLDEYLNICKCAVSLGIKKIRITGGEPLLRNGLLDFCNKLNQLNELEELVLTTNGSLLKNTADDLNKAGISRVNISLDTLNKDKFKYITGIDRFDDVIKGIDKALLVGFKQVKVNVVLMNGFNIDEIPAFIEMTKNNNICIRFIELMPIGDCPKFNDQYVPADIVLKTEPELQLIGVSGVAQIYRKSGYKGTVGLIKPMSDKFCDMCNRIRVTADGKLKTCLHSRDEYDLRGLNFDALRDKFVGAINHKPTSHNLTSTCYSDSLRYMNQIGG